jgi:hypothetical protein
MLEPPHRTKGQPVTIADLIDYLLRRESTRDLAVELAYVHDQRDGQRRVPRLGSER